MQEQKEGEKMQQRLNGESEPFVFEVLNTSKQKHERGKEKKSYFENRTHQETKLLSKIEKGVNLKKM
jgi:hypothetical protein